MACGCQSCGLDSDTHSHRALNWSIREASCDAGMSPFWRVMRTADNFRRGVGHEPDDEVLSALVGATADAGSMLGDSINPSRFEYAVVRGLSDCEEGSVNTPPSSPPAPTTLPGSPKPPPKPKGPLTSVPDEEEPEEPKQPIPGSSAPSMPSSPSSGSGVTRSCCCFIKDARIEHVKFGPQPIPSTKSGKKGTFNPPPDDPRRTHMSEVRITISFGWKPSKKYCPCKFQWWEYSTLISPSYMPKESWTELSKRVNPLDPKAKPGEAWRRPPSGGWPVKSGKKSQSQGEMKNFLEAMDAGGGTGADGSVGCEDLKLTKTTDSDFPALIGGPNFWSLWKSEGKEASRKLYGVIRLYSGCKGGKKAELRWAQEVSSSGVKLLHSWPQPSRGTPNRAQRNEPAFPKGGPPLQPNPSQNRPARFGSGTGTRVSDGEARQPDVHSGDSAPYGPRSRNG